MGKKIPKSLKKFKKHALPKVIEKRRADKKKFQNFKKKGPHSREEKLLDSDASKHVGVERENEGEEKQDDSLNGKQNNNKNNKNNNSNNKNNNKNSNKKNNQSSKSKTNIEDLDVDELLNGAFFDDVSMPDNNSDNEEEEEEDEDVKEAATADDDDDDDAEGNDEDEEDDEESLERDIASYKSTLSSLSSEDPDFYRVLATEEPHLLQFADQIDAEPEPEAEADADVDVDDNEEEAEGKTKKTKDKKDASKVSVNDFASLTSSSLKILITSITVNHSLSSLRQLARVYRSACHLLDEKAGEEVSKDTIERNVALAHSKLFNALMRAVQRNLHSFFDYYFKQVSTKASSSSSSSSSSPSSSSSSSSSSSLRSHFCFRKLDVVLRSFLTNTLHYLSSLRAVSVSSGGQESMVRLLLHHLNEYLHLLEPYPRLQSKLLRALLTMWTSGTHAVRVDAFLRMRQLVLTFTDHYEPTLKMLYLAYVRNAAFTNTLTLPVIEFMCNCVVEMYGLDHEAAYQHCFVYMRQLAIHLRGALQVKTKDSHKSVYNWSFINCLRLFAKILSVHGSDSSSALRPLLYPFTQIALSVLGVSPVPRYYPLRLIVVRQLIRVIESCGVYVPLAPHLLTMFDAPAMKKKATMLGKKRGGEGGGGGGFSTSKYTDKYLECTLKVSKTAASSLAFQSVMSASAVSALTAYFTAYSSSIAFPELIVAPVSFLRKYCKTSRIHSLRKQLMTLVQQLEANATWIVRKREGSVSGKVGGGAGGAGGEDVSKWTPESVAKSAGRIDVVRTFVPAEEREEEEEEEETESSSKSKSKSSKSSNNKSNDGISPLRLIALSRASSSSSSSSTSDSEADWEGKTKKGKKAKGGDDEDDDEDDNEDEDDGDEDDEEGGSKEGGDEDDDEDDDILAAMKAGQTGTELGDDDAEDDVQELVLSDSEDEEK